MKGLLLKDYYMILKYCRLYGLIVLVFGACSLVDQSNLFMLAYPAVLCGINCVTLLSYDERSKWQQYCETLPYTRKQVVDSKYVISCILVSGLSVLLAAAHSLAGAVRGNFDPIWVFGVFCLIWAVGYLFSAICLPMIYKFGSEKGRIMYIAVVIIFCVGFVTFGVNVSDTVQNEETLGFLMANPTCMGAAAVIASVLFVISMKLSERFYMNREL